MGPIFFSSWASVPIPGKSKGGLNENKKLKVYNTSINCVEATENSIFRFYVLSRVRTIRPKLGVFSKMFKIQLFCCFITQLVKKLQQWSLYEVIEDILPFVLNTKRPLSDIWLLSYKQNSFGCFFEKK